MYDFEEERCVGDCHSKMCADYMDACNVICIEKEVAQARMKVEKLDELEDHVLRDCVRDPWIANGLHTLQGMATETCIYNVSDQ
jgi:hypothetical protein